MKKKIFGIIAILVIVIATYIYIKSSSNSEEDSSSDDSSVIKYSSLEAQLRLDASKAYADLKGLGALHPEAYANIMNYTQEQFDKFAEYYAELYPKGFGKHVALQGLAFSKTQELYKIKTKLNQFINAAS